MEDLQEETFVLTEQMCMNLALNEFAIKTSLPMSKAIMERFLELMMLHGHIKKEGDENE